MPRPPPPRRPPRPLLPLNLLLLSLLPLLLPALLPLPARAAPLAPRAPRIASNLAVKRCADLKSDEIAPVVEVFLKPARPRVGGEFRWEARMDVKETIGLGAEMRMRAEVNGKRKGEDAIVQLCPLFKCPVAQGNLTLVTKKPMTVDPSAPVGQTIKMTLHALTAFNDGPKTLFCVEIPIRFSPADGSDDGDDDDEEEEDDDDDDEVDNAGSGGGKGAGSGSGSGRGSGSGNRSGSGSSAGGSTRRRLIARTKDERVVYVDL
ncbi:hypothetical protein DFJ74DRAFT_658676 [Hyaloraphidium curvatum]|nr:hypothetical protein DFJ74DRAFT_658676 [Hyaloraphidium curvatum]